MVSNSRSYLLSNLSRFCMSVAGEEGEPRGKGRMEEGAAPMELDLAIVGMHFINSIPSCKYNKVREPRIRSAHIPADLYFCGQP